MVKGLLLSQFSPAISGAAVPDVIAAANLGQKNQVAMMASAIKKR